MTAARQLEMKFFRDMGVYTKLHRNQMPPGTKLITTKWVDTDKGNGGEPNYRSGLVGQNKEGCQT